MQNRKENAAQNNLDNLIESIADGASVSEKINRLFGRQKSVHNIFGGGKSADMFLWRNKKISSSVLVAATLIWVFFEWIDYHFLTLVCFALVIVMIVQFAWSNAFVFMDRSPSEVPRLVLPNDLFVNAAVSVGAQVNLFLGFIQDVACGRELKLFVMVVLGLWAAAIIGSWCNFLTVLYIGFVGVHTLPVLYEKYEDEVDEFIYNILGLLQHQYRKLDEGVLSKIPKRGLKMKKSD